MLQMIARRNSINRELRGPVHTTGRKHFAQLRFEVFHFILHLCVSSVGDEFLLFSISSINLVLVLKSENMEIWTGI